MSFSLEHRTLISGIIYILKACPEMSAHQEQPNTASESHTAERIEEAVTEFSPDIIKERIKANLEPLHAQINILTQKMYKLFQGNSARTISAVGLRDHRFPSESPLTDRPSTSRTLSLESPPDTRHFGVGLEDNNK